MPPETTNSKQWSVARLHLPADQAIASIHANPAIPDFDREHLVRLITDSGFAGVKVDAHKHVLQGNTEIRISIGKLY